MYDNSPKSVDNLLREGYSTDIGGYVNRGWAILQQKLGSFIGFLLVLVLINLAFSALIRIVDPAAFDPSSSAPPSGAGILVNIISSVISIPLNAGFFIVALKIAKQRTTSFSDFFRGFNYFLQLFLVTLVGGLLIALGFLLLIIPGIYLAVAYTFAIPLVIERKMDFWQALETSRKIITKQWFAFLLLGLVVFLINFLGVLPCGLGLLITVPLTYCIVTAAYESILGLQLSSED